MAVTLHPAPPTAARSVLTSSNHLSSSSLALFPSSNATTPSEAKSRQLIYFAEYGKGNIREERDFIVDTYPLFASLQRIVSDYEATLPLEYKAVSPPAEQVQYYARISSLYRQAMLKQLPLIQANPNLNPEEKENQLQHYSTMHSILSLTEILYFPSDGSGDGVVGEELLDWLNVVDRAPSTEEGTELSSLSQPWDSPTFFPYLTKCLLRGHFSSLSALLNLLITSHSSQTVRSLSKLFLSLLESFPRSTSFPTELSFRSSLKSFKSTSTSILKQSTQLLNTLSSDDLMDPEESSDYVSSFRSLFSLLTLSATVSSSYDSALSTLLSHTDTWQESLTAYLIYLNPLSTRSDLPSILSEILNKGEESIDQTLIEEKVQEKLFRGDVTGLLKVLVGGDAAEGGEEGEYLWLATHLVDLLSHLHLPSFDLPLPRRSDSKGEEEEGLGPREQFLLSYADSSIEGDETLWRVCCEYWGECGGIGRSRIETLLSGGGVELGETQEEETKDGEGMDLEGTQEKKSRKGKNVEEVLTVLGEFGMEDQVKKVCQTYAELLIEKKKFGKAIAYSVRAGDSRKVDRIAYQILNEYVDQGQETFISHVDSLPTSLLRPSSAPSSPTSSSSTLDLLPTNAFQFPSITFLSRYRDFLALYSLASQQTDLEEAYRLKRQSAELLILLLTSGMAPKAFWAVMLLDSIGLLETQPPLVSLSETYELLRVIEEITAPIELSASGKAPVDIFGDLDMLGRLLEGQVEEGEKNKEGGEDRMTRALGQLKVVREALARHLAICCCL